MPDVSVVGSAKSIHGDDLTIFDGEFGRVAFDEDGCGPYIHVTGCPNCRKHAGEWWDPMTFVASRNSGRDPNATCSRVCTYQLEWQADIAARELTSRGRSG